MIENNLKRGRVAIVSCRAISREIEMVARERQTEVPFALHVFDAQHHRDPCRLGELLESTVGRLNSQPGVGLFIAYGNCYPEDRFQLRGYHLKAVNCFAALLGGNSIYERLAEKTYFLTPYFALNWKEFFWGPHDYAVGHKNRERLKKWFNPIERIVKINIGSETLAHELESAKELSTLIEKPLVVVDGCLDFLREEYNKFLYERV